MTWREISNLSVHRKLEHRDTSNNLNPRAPSVGTSMEARGNTPQWGRKRWQHSRAHTVQSASKDVNAAQRIVTVQR